MIIREAAIKDIGQLQTIRTSVTENALSDPAMIKVEDYQEFLLVRGKGWVMEAEEIILGFAIVDLLENNVWALFILPGSEQRGIGRRLHDQMLDWYFAQTDSQIWLSTSPGTRAVDFYQKAGWAETGTYGKGEIKFTMTSTQWLNADEKK